MAVFRCRAGRVEYRWPARRSERLLLAGVSVIALVLIAACGTQHGTSSPPLTGPSSSLSAKPSFPECPQVPGVVDPSPCASVGAEQNQQANQTFNSRIPLMNVSNGLTVRGDSGLGGEFLG
jgi:hypothetical protein